MKTTATMMVKRTMTKNVVDVRIPMTDMVNVQSEMNVDRMAGKLATSDEIMIADQTGNIDRMAIAVRIINVLAAVNARMDIARKVNANIGLRWTAANMKVPVLTLTEALMLIAAPTQIVAKREITAKDVKDEVMALSDEALIVIEQSTVTAAREVPKDATMNIAVRQEAACRALAAVLVPGMDSAWAEVSAADLR